MHIEKNVFDSFLGTFWDLLGKLKDHKNSLYDLHDIGICKEHQLVEDVNYGKFHLAKAYFYMKPEDKKIF